MPPGVYRLELAVHPERGWEVTQSATDGLLRIAPGDVLGPLEFLFAAPETGVDASIEGLAPGT